VSVAIQTKHVSDLRHEEAGREVILLAGFFVSAASRQ
jgi:hypothetical protein